MAVSVDPVASGRDLAAFVDLPWRLYKDDPHWVPPLKGDVKKLLDRGKNPFFAHGEIEPYLARDARGRVTGRIAAIRNRAHEEFHGEAVGFFGFFECEDDPEAAAALLDAARAFSRERGLPLVRGPMNPSTNEECGILVDGFDTPPMVMMTHGRPYYDALLKACGAEKAKDLVAYHMTDRGLPERLRRGAALAERRNPDVRVEPLDMKNFTSEVERFRRVYNAAWERNWGFVPMTDAEVDHMAAELKRVIDPGLVRFATRNGETVAFAFALPDVNQALRHANGSLFPLGFLKVLWHMRKIDAVRVIALGLLPEIRRSGIDVILYRDIFEYGTGKGFHRGEFSWILEDNTVMRRPLDSIGAEVYKTYRIYETPSRPA